MSTVSSRGYGNPRFSRQGPMGWAPPIPLTGGERQDVSMIWRPDERMSGPRIRKRSLPEAGRDHEKGGGKPTGWPDDDNTEESGSFADSVATPRGTHEAGCRQTLQLWRQAFLSLSASVSLSRPLHPPTRRAVPRPTRCHNRTPRARRTALASLPDPPRCRLSFRGDRS